MKKLFLLLITFCLLATACNGGLGDDESNPTPSIPKIELSQQTIDVDFEPNTYTISVTSPYSWKATSDSEWITVESKTGIAGTEELVFSVTHNTEVKERKGTIAITNSIYNLVAELYVIQEAFEPSDIVANPNSLNFTVEGGEKEIAITANFEYEADTSADWVKITKTENGITVTVPTYDEAEERSADIVISSEKYDISKTLKVTQKAFEPEISIDTETLNFAAEGGKEEIAITANFEYEVAASADWITFTKTKNGISITVANNYKNSNERTATITISSKNYNTSKTVKITQAGLSQEEYAKRSILYTTSNGEIITLYNKEDVFRANIISNTYDYENGQGVILFDTPITSIGEKAFYNSRLTSITIPDSVTSIGGEAFAYCDSLTSITIPDSVTSIGEGAFCYCTSLTSITIGNSVTSIREGTFEYCISLTSVYISDLSAWCKITFGSADANPLLYAKNLYLNGELVTELTIPSDITEIKNYTFYGCSSLTSVTIGNSVTSIGNRTFSSCTSLTSITIPNSVTSIGDSAFYSCSSLTSVTIPNSVTSIGEGAFEFCSSLTSVTIPDSVTSIGENAFRYCTSLTSVTIGNSVTSIGRMAFCFCTSLTSVYCKPTTPPRGDDYMFSNNASGRKIYVPTASVGAYMLNWGGSYWSDIVGYDF